MTQETRHPEKTTTNQDTGPKKTHTHTHNQNYLQQIFVKITPITQALKKHNKKEISSSEALNTT
jgi:hypothetical protein